MMFYFIQHLLQCSSEGPLIKKIFLDHSDWFLQCLIRTKLCKFNYFLKKYIPGIPTNEYGEDEEEEFKLEAVR